MTIDKNDQNQILSENGSTSESRRKFLKTAGKTAAVVPAVNLLLAASSTTVSAQGIYDTVPTKKVAKKLATKKVATK